MKLHSLGILAGTILALLDSRTGRQGQTPDAPECARLLTNPAVHPLAGIQAKSGYISTNTMAFQNYALQSALEQYRFINRGLNWGGPDPVGCSNVSKFVAYPNYYGLHSSVTVDRRFSVLIQNNRISNFSDLDFWLAALENRPARLEWLLAQTNLLTKKSAEKVARDALKALGLENRKNVQLREPPYVMQWQTDSGPMPFYKIQWKEKGFRGPNDGLNGTSISMEICGVSSNVSHFFIVGLPSNRAALQVPSATNFFQLLGMSETNQFRQMNWKTETE